MFKNPPDEVIRQILSKRHTIAVVGCSPKPQRDSHHVASILMQRGHRVIPVNPGHREILGVTCYPDLPSIPDPVDMVDVFRRSEHVGPITDQAIQIGAKILWLQLGVWNEEAAEKALQAGMTVIMDRCPAIEYRRLRIRLS